MMHSTVTGRGQTTLPAALRARLGLKAGDRIVYEERDGDVVLRVHPGVRAVAGMLHAELVRRSDGDFEAEREAAHEAWGRDGAGEAGGGDGASGGGR
ncbi:AbrB/MazE/SpoVT family DNA-binding domain-containing protein [Phycisphaera mikurensis]|uniref:SpoVT-AbrB domain-containing protein n=1 Tax=Phycisphaera mikurensis (strain NBRC 102666 / KCTC 22515 / FYK2301M01) TaxID=1142394 RepID=I0IAF0_PHYMF|nr:type II toxin-antitoxin system PrlF family antitoxin [Phycisphaera mikurensis]MBB6441766.1 AbrB family looped-hinge helix DNA binding protein [Phycisphaera mikurensis]BAM02238.1 hypothetical protein PSMK_00790 [Phycisphaera mikurensis NBRC 102666]